MARLMRRFLHTALLPLALLAAPPATAQPAPATLVDAWLGWQQQRQAQQQQQPPLDWAYSFALRRAEAAELDDRRTRLIAELETLGPVLRAAGEPRLPATLRRWADRLREQPARPARSPQPLDLPSLAGELRRNPPMTEIATLGTCRPPSWVEAWTLDGVQRLPWRPGLTLDALRAELPAAATRDIDRLSLVTPRGHTRTLGIAAWNHQDAPLAPGARLAVRLPERSVEARLINRELVAFLASRLPGDDCTLWQN